METSHNTNSGFDEVEDRLWYVDIDRYILEEVDVHGWSENDQPPDYWYIKNTFQAVPAETLFKTRNEATKYLYKIAKARIAEIERFMYEEIIGREYCEENN